MLMLGGKNMLKILKDGRTYKLSKTKSICKTCPFVQKDIECPRNKYDLLRCAFEENGGLRRGIHAFRETLPSKIASWIRGGK